ncbi:MAG: PQQ-dependent sugar dehydrogenase [Pseudomonadota bacterium]
MWRWSRAGLGRLLLVAAVGVAAVQPARAEDRFRVETVATGLEHPWSLAFLPNGDALVTERPGRLRRLTTEQQLGTPIGGLPDDLVATGQGGLLDVAVDPDHVRNGLIYLSYSARGDGGMTTRVVRGRLDDATLTDLRTLLTVEPFVRGGRHFGSRLAFGADGMLYVTVGDRGQRTPAQDRSTLIGSVVRIMPDGSVPPDNPFVDDAAARPELFAFGTRNAQGLAVDPATGRLWAHEHGPRGGDEVNLVASGANYGWPTVTFGTGYDLQPIGVGTWQAGTTQPLHVWVPSIAPSGLAVYRGTAFPDWEGDLLVGALRDQMLVRLDVEGEEIVGEERLLQNELGRIRDVRVGPDDYVYLLTDEADGGVFRLVPTD